MPSWFKQATYIASTGAALAATLLPQYSIVLVSLSTFLAGLATTHPADSQALSTQSQAVKDLTAQLLSKVATATSPKGGMPPNA